MKKSKISKGDQLLIIALCAICLSAFIIRISLIIYTLNVPGAYGTTILIGETARNLAEGRGYVIDKAYLSNLNELVSKNNKLVDIEDVPPPSQEIFTPFYNLAPGSSGLLAVTYILSGEHRFLPLRILQALIDSMGCLIIFLVGKTLFSRKVGLIASAIYAVFLPIAFLSTIVIHDALMPVLVLTSLYFFIKGVQTKKYLNYVLSVIFVGISCYFQPTVMFLPVIYGISMLIYSLNKNNLKKQIVYTLKATGFMLLILTIIVVPWIIRNYQVTGVLTPNMRVVTWAALWEGMGEFPDNPAGAKLEDSYALSIARQELGYDVEFGSPEFDSVFKKKVITTIREHPLWYLSALVQRFPRTIIYVNSLGIGQRCPDDLDWKDCQKLNANWMNLISAAKNGKIFEFVIDYPYITFYWGLVAAFAIIPVFLSLVAIWITRKNWRKLILLAAVPAYFSLVHMVVFVSGAGKSLLPGSIVFILLSAVTLDYILGKIQCATNSQVNVA